LLLLCLAILGIGAANAQKKAKGVIRKSVSTSISSDYKQVGSTYLYCYQSSSSIDFMGLFGSQYYGCTFGDNGYRVAMQVGSGSAEQVDCLDGTTLDGVTFTASVEQQGELARICYNLTNTNERDTVVSLGIHADIMIGSNDSAPISKRIDTTGKTYGLTLMDGNGAQLCALFGSNLKGVTGADDYWFGSYYENDDASQMVGNYTQGNNWMVENGSYDSGMGFCWKNRTIPAGATVTFSWLIGVGDVSLEPSSSFEVTPDDPEGWNDLSRPHRLTLEGEYESPAGLDGMIEYAVENSEEWIPLTDTLASGSTFTASLVANFDSTLSTHTIHFRTVDNVGNATLLPPIEYEDVSYHELQGIMDFAFTGDSLFQEELSCDLADSLYILNYQNNINAGTASVSMDGVFPYTIGRKHYSFTINPARLSGNASLELDTYYEYYAYGDSITPGCLLTYSANGDTLILGIDYTVAYYDNVLPGAGRVVVKGIGNYTDSLERNFTIAKSPIYWSYYYNNWEYDVTLPAEDILYDGQPHGATFSDSYIYNLNSQGVGEPKFIYTLHNDYYSSLDSVPIEAGEYDIYLEFAEGDFYQGSGKFYVGTFAIYNLDENEWYQLQNLCEALQYQCLWYSPWDISLGVEGVSTFTGLEVKQGHVTGINLSYSLYGGEPPIKELLSFPNLTKLDLSNNSLYGNLPARLAEAIEQDPSLGNNLDSLSISGNSLSGNLGLLASCLPNLTKLYASYNAFEDINPMISTSVTELDISNQTIDRTIEVDLSNYDMSYLADQIPTILLYDHWNQTYKTELSVSCTMWNWNWEMQVSYADGQLSMPYISEQNAFHGTSGEAIDAYALSSEGYQTGDALKVAFIFERGDANFMGGVDASDLQATILYAFGGYREYPFNFTAADTYTDGNINVQDVVCTVDILLSTENTYAKAMRKANAATESSTNAEAYIYAKNGNVYLYAERPIAAISVKATNGIHWDIERYGMTQTTNGSNLVGYSLDGVTLPAGEHLIGTCSNGTTITEASIADAEARPMHIAIGENVADAINDMKSLDAGDTEIYDLSGRRQTHLKNGINIVNKGGHAVKIFNKNNK